MRPAMMYLLDLIAKSELDEMDTVEINIYELLSSIEAILEHD